MVSVLPPGIDVRKRQRSHSEISRVEPLSGSPKLCSDRLLPDNHVGYWYPIYLSSHPV